MEKDLLKIIETYGVLNQLKHFQSEVYEITEAIIEYETESFYCLPSTKHIAEEIADVLVMLNQFIEYYKLDRNNIELTMNNKIKRQLGRIERGE